MRRWEDRKEREREKKPISIHASFFWSTLEHPVRAMLEHSHTVQRETMMHT